MRDYLTNLLLEMHRIVMTCRAQTVHGHLFFKAIRASFTLYNTKRWSMLADVQAIIEERIVSLV